MNYIVWLPVLFYFSVFSTQRSFTAFGQQAKTPPRGWNSYDSFSWTINEEEFLQSAKIVSEKLLAHGYDTVVVDYLWYRRNSDGAAHANSLGHDMIDEWGRMIPDPDRWPSSRGGIGFREVSKKVHAMGLKFGIHIMRGISTQAVNGNTPVLDVATGKAYSDSGRQWNAKDIGLTDRKCPWMSNGFMSVNTNLGAARAFLRSLQQQYADWGVDFVKHDCVFGEDLDVNEITEVSQILKDLGRPVLYSLSPGKGATPAMAAQVSPLVNMFRVTGDDWDRWDHLLMHFDVASSFSGAHLIGNQGLKGYSWPDLDMLPMGWLTDPAGNKGPYRQSSFTLDEQRTQMTLWSMAKSPLMFGGDVRKLDDATYNIIANPILLEINSFSQNNVQFPYVTGIANGTDVQPITTNDLDSTKIKPRSWVATGRSGEVYVAFFNLSPDHIKIYTTLYHLDMIVQHRNLTTAKCIHSEVWSASEYRDIPRGTLIRRVAPHGCALFVIKCT